MPVLSQAFADIYPLLQANNIPINEFLITGKGLNPLLQNFWMQIHPPILFTGFALTSIPFSFAIAALMKNEYKDWVKQSFPWMLTAAGVLGLGIMMGGYWAYGVLGWGRLLGMGILLKIPVWFPGLFVSQQCTRSWFSVKHKTSRTTLGKFTPDKFDSLHSGLCSCHIQHFFDQKRNSWQCLGSLICRSGQGGCLSSSSFSS